MTIRCRFQNTLRKVALLVAAAITSIGIVGGANAQPAPLPVKGQGVEPLNPREPHNEETSGTPSLSRPVQEGVRNVLDNLDVVRRLTNNIIQLKFMGAVQEVTRFSINSTMGVVGVLDLAKDGFSLEENDHGEWVILNWLEKPAHNDFPVFAKGEDRTEFLKVYSFNKKRNNESWPAVRQNIHEGDLIAYRMEKWEARKSIFLKAKFNLIGYRLFKYGHMAIAVSDSKDEDNLRLLSSQAFKGPNIREDIDTLKDHSWDVYRLNRWHQVDKVRFYEFIELVQQKAGNWNGYDFSGIFGLWNSNLRPNNPEDVSRTYSCSTVILAALHYAGLRLDAIHWQGIADIVTPLQVVTSKGRIVPSSEVTMQASSDRIEVEAEPLHAYLPWDLHKDDWLRGSRSVFSQATHQEDGGDK